MCFEFNGSVGSTQSRRKTGSFLTFKIFVFPSKTGGPPNVCRVDVDEVVFTTVVDDSFAVKSNAVSKPLTPFCCETSSGTKLLDVRTGGDVADPRAGE